MEIKRFWTSDEYGNDDEASVSVSCLMDVYSAKSIKKRVMPADQTSSSGP